MTAASSGAALLDVNILIALAWPNHVHHRAAHGWFAKHHRSGWATTPITEAGFVRVSSNRSAITTATTPAIARQVLTSMTRQAGHAFWPDDVALVVGTEAEAGVIRTHRDVTDAHLIALAQRHQGRLVSFDVGLGRLLAGRDPQLLDLQRAS